MTTLDDDERKAAIVELVDYAWATPGVRLEFQTMLPYRTCQILRLHFTPEGGAPYMQAL